MFPNRMNLVEIVVKKLSKTKTHWDDDFEEPVGKKDRTVEVTVMGQPNLAARRFERRDPSRTGDREPSNARITFRKSDLESKGVEIAKGDRVVKIGSLETDFLVAEVRPESPLDEEFLLVVAELEENKEERKSL